MTKEELEKEFTKYLKDSSDYYDPREPLTERKLLQMWLDCAEPREKRIAELEAQNEELKAENELIKNSDSLCKLIGEQKLQIEKMKCCENCAYRTVDFLTFTPVCDKRKLQIENPLTCKCDEWKLVN